MSKATIFKAEFAGLRTTKKGQIITMLLPKESNDIEKVAELMKYEGKPVEFALRVDMIEEGKKNSLITENQRKAIYKLLKDLGEHLGLTLEEAKETLKNEYVLSNDGINFSLSDCHIDKAKDFINFLIIMSMDEGINVENWIKSESDKLIEISTLTKKCIVCGNDGEIHHIDAIGMGRDRKKVDDTEYRKICLCRKHHDEIHRSGIEYFERKYQLNLGGN